MCYLWEILFFCEKQSVLIKMSIKQQRQLENFVIKYQRILCRIRLGADVFALVGGVDEVLRC